MYSKAHLPRKLAATCTEVHQFADGGYNRLAEKEVLAGLQKAAEISASNIVIGEQDGILTARVVEVANVLLSNATPSCSPAVPGAELSSVAPQSDSGMLEGVAASSQQSAMALAVVQGATDLRSQAASNVAVTGAVTVADIQPVRYTLKDPHLRFACCECESAVQHRTCKHQLAVLMKLFPGLESRRTMLMFLGTRLGMKGGCQPDCAAPDSLWPLLNQLQQLRAAADMPLLVLPDAARVHAGAPSSAGVTSVQLTSTSSASCPSEQCGVASVTRTMPTPQQRADALSKEVHSLFQASLQLALSPQDPAQQVQLLRKLKAGMEHTVHTVKAEATTVPATVHGTPWGTSKNTSGGRASGSCQYLCHAQCSIPICSPCSISANQHRNKAAHAPSHQAKR
jgi:hypothetical protein